MISDTTDTETNCLSFSQDWNPTTGGTAISDDTSIQWDLDETSRVENGEKDSSLETELILPPEEPAEGEEPVEVTFDTTSTSKSNTLYLSIRNWCMAAANIIVTAPTDLGISLDNFNYQNLAPEELHAFNGFTTSGDENCDPYDLVITSETTRASDGTSWTDKIPKFKIDDTLGPVLSFASGSNEYVGTLTSYFSAILPRDLI